MNDTETIGEMFGRFQKITNTLKNLGERIEQPRQVKKILRSLPKSWMPKVTAIQEAKDLEKMTVEELMGSLMTHEVLVNQKEKVPSELKGKRALALKAESETDEEQSSSGNSESEDEVAMLSRRIKTIMKRKKGRLFSNTNTNDKRKSVPMCYKCKKPGHFQFECEEKKLENKTEGKRYSNLLERKGPSKPFNKKKRAMLAWEMIEQLMGNDSSESEVEEKHEANVGVINNATDERRICFMALDDNSEVTSHTEDYDFEEMLYKLYADFTTLKKEHTKLQRKHMHANENNEKLKIENENLKNANTSKSNEINKLKIENNALRKSLNDAVSN